MKSDWLYLKFHREKSYNIKTFWCCPIKIEQQKSVKNDTAHTTILLVLVKLFLAAD
jgi:hypothetical protein